MNEPKTNKMTDKQFNAVLAKNIIARQVRDYQNDGININLIISCLEDIETVIGQANQPTVEDIINTKGI